MLKEFRTQRIIWDTANARLFEPIQAVEGDQQGRRLEVQLINKGEVVDLSGTSLALAWKTRDELNKGLEGFEVVDSEKGIFELYYPTGMLAHKGRLTASLVFYDDNGRIESREFQVFVQPSVIDDEAVESSDSFTALTQAIVQINEFDGRIEETNRQLAQKATKEEVQSIASGSPKGVYPSLADLQNTFPTGNTNIYVVSEDGKWYYWNGSAWQSGGIYQASSSNEFPATNLVSNGDFSNGIEGWNINTSYGSITNVEGAGRIGSRYPSYPAYQIKNTFTGHKYYFRLSAKSEGAYGPARCGLVSSTSMSEGQVEELTLNTDMQDFSFIIEATADYDRICWMRRPNSSAIEYCVIDNVLVIDLTETFGAGKEPTVEEMEKLLERFTNKWFDGTVAPFVSQKELFELVSKGGNTFTDTTTGKKYTHWLSAENGNLVFNYEEVL